MVSTLMYGPGRLREMQSSINCIEYFLGIGEWNMAHWCSTHITKLRKSGGKLLCTSARALHWVKTWAVLSIGGRQRLHWGLVLLSRSSLSAVKKSPAKYFRRCLGCY